MQVPEIVPFNEGARMLRVNPRTAHNSLKDPKRAGTFPRPFKIGRRYFYRAQDLINWVNDRAESANAHLAEAN